MALKTDFIFNTLFDAPKFQSSDNLVKLNQLPPVEHLEPYGVEHDYLDDKDPTIDPVLKGKIKQELFKGIDDYFNKGLPDNFLKKEFAKTAVNVAQKGAVAKFEVTKNAYEKLKAQKLAENPDEKHPVISRRELVIQELRDVAKSEGIDLEGIDFNEKDALQKLNARYAQAIEAYDGGYSEVKKSDLSSTKERKKASPSLEKFAGRFGSLLAERAQEEEVYSEEFRRALFNKNVVAYKGKDKEPDGLYLAGVSAVGKSRSLQEAIKNLKNPGDAKELFDKIAIKVDGGDLRDLSREYRRYQKVAELKGYPGINKLDKSMKVLGRLKNTMSNIAFKNKELGFINPETFSKIVMPDQMLTFLNALATDKDIGFKRIIAGSEDVSEKTGKVIAEEVVRYNGESRAQTSDPDNLNEEFELLKGLLEKEGRELPEFLEKPDIEDKAQLRNLWKAIGVELEGYEDLAKKGLLTEDKALQQKAYVRLRESLGNILNLGHPDNVIAEIQSFKQKMQEFKPLRPEFQDVLKQLDEIDFNGDEVSIRKQVEKVTTQVSDILMGHDEQSLDRLKSSMGIEEDSEFKPEDINKQLGHLSDLYDSLGQYGQVYKNKGEGKNYGPKGYRFGDEGSKLSQYLFSVLRPEGKNNVGQNDLVLKRMEGTTWVDARSGDPGVVRVSERVFNEWHEAWQKKPDDQKTPEDKADLEAFARKKGFLPAYEKDATFSLATRINALFTMTAHKIYFKMEQYKLQKKGLDTPERQEKNERLTVGIAQCNEAIKAIKSDLAKNFNKAETQFKELVVKTVPEKINELGVPKKLQNSIKNLSWKDFDSAAEISTSQTPAIESTKTNTADTRSIDDLIVDINRASEKIERIERDLNQEMRSLVHLETSHVKKLADLEQKEKDLIERAKKQTDDGYFKAAQSTLAEAREVRQKRSELESAWELEFPDIKKGSLQKISEKKQEMESSLHQIENSVHVLHTKIMNASDPKQGQEVYAWLVNKIEHLFQGIQHFVEKIPKPEWLKTVFDDWNLPKHQVDPGVQEAKASIERIGQFKQNLKKVISEIEALSEKSPETPSETQRKTL